jgi:hypothetical protein
VAWRGIGLLNRGLSTNPILSQSSAPKSIDPSIQRSNIPKNITRLRVSGCAADCDANLQRTRYDLKGVVSTVQRDGFDGEKRQDQLVVAGKVLSGGIGVNNRQSIIDKLTPKIHN